MQNLSKAILMVMIVLGLVACTSSEPEERLQTTSLLVSEQPPATSTVTPISEPTPYPLSEADPVLLGTYATMLPNDMRSELEQLFTELESRHPNLYAQRSQAEVELERQQITNELNQTVTNVEFFSVVAPLVASLGDAHTRVLPSHKIIREMLASEIFLPLGVEFDERQAFITEEYSDNTQLTLGAELLAINGTDIFEIHNWLTDRGWTDYPFYFALWFLYGTLPEYQITALLPGATSAVNFNVPGMGYEAIYQKVTETNPQVTRPPISYQQLADEKIGLLTLNSFEDLTAALKPVFTEIQADAIEHLIIDVRLNRGGKYEQIDLLMRYLTDQPYQQCSWRYFAAQDGAAGPQEAECRVKEPSPTPLRYTEELYLLIGPETYSAAITFATILQDHSLALLLGEETRDTASYCAFVSDDPQVLSVNLLYKCSARCFIRPSGGLDERGVIPDIIVETTVPDKLADRDPVLDYTLEMIKSGTAP